MNKSKLIIAVILSIVFAALAVVLATPAQAAGGCVTKREFRKLDTGDTIGLVRAIVGQRGRTLSTNYFSDGDAWKTVEFRQCGKSWKRSFITMSFELRENEEYVSDWECYDYGDCYDWGYYQTVYSHPFELTSKSAYWS